MDLFSGKSDPFLEVKHGSQSHRSPTCFSTLEPVWNDTLCFDYKPLNDIHIEMYDHDDYFFFHTSQYAGQVSIPVNTLEFQKEHQCWYSFTDADNLSDVN